MRQTAEDIVLEARGIAKTFPGVRALEDVTLTLRRGQVTALVGENGAGKSTLMNILGGVLRPDSGQLVLEGMPVQFGAPHEARDQGIAVVFQELSLLTNLSIAENIFLGREPRTRWGLIDYAAMHEHTRALLGRLALQVPPDTPVGALRVGQQQLVEIARALATNPRVLILDEPTSALSDREVDVLFERVAELKREGVAIVYITHKLEELARICDDVVIMRDGRNVAAAPLATLTLDAIVRHMVGRDPRELFEKRTSLPGAEVLRVEQLSLRRADRPGERVVDEVSFAVCSGEVLGIFGLMGAGRTELLETIYGVHGGLAAGHVAVDGQKLTLRSPAEAVACGLALAPEDRKRDGLVLEMSVRENASLACTRHAGRFGLVSESRETAMIAPLVERFRVKTASLEQRVRTLSGGNQQKVILAKWLATNPRVLLLDEPTRGIDLSAKKEIYALIDELAQQGLAVVVVSSELPEVLALSDRVMVMCQGRKTAEFARSDATPEAVMRAALPRVV
jgi:ribose transport system ATP-binding protein